MAEISEIRLKDFRAFRSASLKVDPSGLMLVAGPNNSGKSSLLSAFDVVAGMRVPQEMRHAAGERAQIWARWKLSEAEQLTILGEGPETPLLIDGGAAEWLDWEFSEFHGLIQPVTASVSWPGQERLEFARIRENGPMGWARQIASDPLSTWSRNLSDGHGRSDRMSDTLVEFRGSTSVQMAADILRRWREGYFHFQSLREAHGRESALANIRPTLASSGENLANVLLYMRNNRPDVWEQLVALVEQLVPGVGRLMTPMEENQFSIVFQDQHVPAHRHNLKDLGTGVEQILMTLVLGLTQTATTVLLEEPEAGLHPGAQRALLALLHEWSKDRLFVATTHSAAMLDWVSPTAHVVAVSRTGIESTAALVTTERSEVLRELGVRLSDVLSADRILILEGPTDKDVFDVWFPEVTRNPRVVVVDGGGGYNARHAELFVQWLETVDQLGTRRVLYARDGDELSATFLEKLKASPYVYVLPCRELENLLLNFDAISTVLTKERAEAGKDPVEAGVIATEARTLADALKATVVLKRVMADLAEPIRLVDNRLRGELSKANANEADLRGAVLPRIPEAANVEATIAEKWQAHRTDVDAAWEDEWLDIAPGADVLEGLWWKYLERHYKKGRDGVAIAEAMRSAPQNLTIVLSGFMAYDSE